MSDQSTMNSVDQKVQTSDIYNAQLLASLKSPSSSVSSVVSTKPSSPSSLGIMTPNHSCSTPISMATTTTANSHLNNLNNHNNHNNHPTFIAATTTSSSSSPTTAGTLHATATSLPILCPRVQTVPLPIAILPNSAIKIPAGAIPASIYHHYPYVSQEAAFKKESFPSSPASSPDDGNSSFENGKKEPNENMSRREAHRAVERRRRDNINSGIKDLSKLVPGFHKSKGNVIQRTVDYLKDLQNSVSNFEKDTKSKKRRIEKLEEIITLLFKENAALRKVKEPSQEEIENTFKTIEAETKVT